MHIVDGALSAPTLAAGAMLSVAGVAVGLKKMDMDHIPQAGLMSAVFFIASLVHVPVGATSVHLILNGLVGLILGWLAFPALLIALLLQAVFFGFGGLIILGVNTFNIALPAVLMCLLLRRFIVRSTARTAAIWGAAAGAGAILLTMLLVAACLAFEGQGFWIPAQAAVIAHIPIMILEGFITAATVYLIVKVKPELFGYALHDQADSVGRESARDGL